MPKHPAVFSERGFTLIELAIVMVVIGLLAGGGVSLMGILSERRMRNETSEYLNDAKNSLISFAKINGRLPWADNVTSRDGDEDPGISSGYFPYRTLNFRPTDSNKRVLRYEINSNIDTDRPASCAALRSGLTGSPLVVDSDGSPSDFSVAAVLISAGQKDADGDNNVFDDITTGTYQGDNRDGNPRYIRHPPIDTFDDLVVYISGYELYGEICGDPVLTVSNSSTTNNVFIYNTTHSMDIGQILPGSAESYSVISGEKFELRTASGGGGSLVTSEFTVSGSGVLLDVSP